MVECTFKSKISISEGTIQTAERIAIHVLRHAIILGRRIEWLIKQALRSGAIVDRAGEQQVNPVGELLAESDPALVGVKCPVVERSLDAIDLPALLGDDVDDTEEGIVPVKHRAWAANDFD